MGITLARELPPGNGRHSRFDHRSVPSPPPLSDLLLLLLLQTTLRYNTETFLEFLLAIPVNKFEDGCRNPSPSIFEISILDDTWIERERENWTYRETELDRSKILAIRVAE